LNSLKAEQHSRAGSGWQAKAGGGGGKNRDIYQTSLICSKAAVAGRFFERLR
jgi:hypothetical protein